VDFLGLIRENTYINQYIKYLYLKELLIGSKRVQNYLTLLPTISRSVTCIEKKKGGVALKLPDYVRKR
jgi:hypothetical protein